MSEMANLIFTHYSPNDEIPDEAFQITAIVAFDDEDASKGEAWLWQNTHAKCPDDAENGISEGSCWIDTKAEFDRLHAKAEADGLTVELDER